MAKVVSPVWSSIRGSICGTTYLTTSAGQIIARQRTRPTQPVTNNRTAIKNAFTEAVADWALLSDADQAAWQAWAIAHTGRSGRHEMIGGKSILRYCAELPFPTGPVIVAGDKCPEFSTTPSMTLVAGPPALPGTGISVKITNTGAVAVYGVIEISQAFGVSRHYWKGPWNVLTQQGGAIAAAASLTKDFIVGSVGDKVFARARIVTNDNATHKKGHIVATDQIVSAIVSTSV
jgi:hypothetical protein